MSRTPRAASGVVVLGLAVFLGLCLSPARIQAHEQGPPGYYCDDDGPFGLPGVTGVPAVVGEWSPVLSWPEQATHAVLLHTGKVLWWRGKEMPTTTYLWDPDTAALEERDVETDLFCAGHSTLADGRVIAFGGTVLQIEDTSIFDPVAETWERTTDMAHERYYPTATTLADGRVLSIGGYPAPLEIFDPATDEWTELAGGQYVGAAFYPRMYLLTTGKLLRVGQSIASRLLDLSTETWSTVATPNYTTFQSGIAMYRPDQFLKTGGDNLNGPPEQATLGVEVLDMGDASPAWREVALMQWPRRRIHQVLMPDGKVLALAGSVEGESSPECAVHALELWDPDTEMWTQLASHARPRIYHSTSLLLPDGRILLGGGENSHVAGGERNYEIFSPPYLFQGPRPVVTSMPDAVDHDESFRVDTPDAATIASVAFMRPGAMTHNYDQNQRYVPVSFQVEDGYLDVTAPLDANLAPPGYYMLFLVDTAGVPSVAEFIRLDIPETPDPEVPALSAWGVIVSGALVMGSGVLASGRRRAQRRRSG